MRRALAFALLVIEAGCAQRLQPPPTAGAAESITIDVDHIAIVCTGFCPSFVVTVRQDEWIELVLRPYGDPDAPPRVRRWRGRPGDFVRLRAMLAPIRPEGVRYLGEPCTGDLCNEERPYSYIISWSGPGAASRLIANPRGNTVYCRLWRGVAGLGFRPATGERDEGTRTAPLSSLCDSVLGERH